jgi:hypothetical protein
MIPQDACACSIPQGPKRGLRSRPQGSNVTKTDDLISAGLPNALEHGREGDLVSMHIRDERDPHGVPVLAENYVRPDAVGSHLYMIV